MDKLAKLKYTRNVYKNKLDAGMSDLDALIEKALYVDAETKMDVISGLTYKLEEVNAAIMDLVEGETDLQLELDEEGRLLELKADLASKARKISVANVPPSNNKSSGFKNDDTKGGVRVKLPILHLPNFDGSVNEFMGWHEMFLSTIHNNPKLSDIDRFSYLKSFLVGRAKDVVDGISLTSANYSVALELLRKRFSRPRLIVKSLLGELFPRVEVAHNFESLKDLYAKFQVTFRHIENLKAWQNLSLDSESVGFILGVLLQWKLPGEIALAFERKFDDVPMPSFKETLLFLENEIQHFENLVLDKQFQNDRNSNRGFMDRFNSGNKRNTIDSLRVSTSDR